MDIIVVIHQSKNLINLLTSKTINIFSILLTTYPCETDELEVATEPCSDLHQNFAFYYIDKSKNLFEI